jgi:hypothetical protein
MVTNALAIRTIGVKLALRILNLRVWAMIPVTEPVSGQLGRLYGADRRPASRCDPTVLATVRRRTGTMAYGTTTWIKQEMRM